MCSQRPFTFLSNGRRPRALRRAKYCSGVRGRQALYLRDHLGQQSVDRRDPTKHLTREGEKKPSPGRFGIARIPEVDRRSYAICDIDSARDVLISCHSIRRVPAEALHMTLLTKSRSCPSCTSSHVSRSHPRGIFERYIFPVIAIEALPLPRLLLPLLYSRRHESTLGAESRRADLASENFIGTPPSAR